MGIPRFRSGTTHSWDVSSGKLLRVFAVSCVFSRWSKSAVGGRKSQIPVTAQPLSVAHSPTAHIGGGAKLWHELSRDAIAPMVQMRAHHKAIDRVVVRLPGTAANQLAQPRL